MTNLPVKEERNVTYTAFGTDQPIKLSLGIVRTVLPCKTRNGSLPSDPDVMRFIMMCQASRLNPFAGDAFLVGYDGKDGPVFSLITAHQAFLKRAENSKDFDGMLSGVIVKRDGQTVEIEGDFYEEDDVLVGAWAKVFRKNLSMPFYRRAKLKTFKKPTSVWDSNPGGMIVKCAEGDSLRSAFPTMLGGLYNAEEGGQPLRDIVDTQPAREPGNASKASELAKKAVEVVATMQPKEAAQSEYPNPSYFDQLTALYMDLNESATAEEAALFVSGVVRSFNVPKEDITTDQFASMRNTIKEAAGVK